MVNLGFVARSVLGQKRFFSDLSSKCSAGETRLLQYIHRAEYCHRLPEEAKEILHNEVILKSGLKYMRL